jgi:peptide/nickel transport system permease protein
MLLSLALAAMGGITLARFAPGLGVDEREFDARLSPDAVAAIRQQAQPPGWGELAGRFLHSLTTGDWGESITFTAPVSDLLRDRVPFTFAAAAKGLLMAWVSALALAMVLFCVPSPWLHRGAEAASTTLLCIPMGLTALALFAWRAPVEVGIAAVVWPQVFRYAQETLRAAAREPHLLTAAAMGLSRGRMFIAHVLPPVSPALIALLGVSAPLALGAAIPVEVLCDAPGLGHLTWKAVLGRDLPLLQPLILVVSVCTLASNLFAELSAPTLEAQP